VSRIFGILIEGWRPLWHDCSSMQSSLSLSLSHQPFRLCQVKTEHKYFRLEIKEEEKKAVQAAAASKKKKKKKKKKEFPCYYLFVVFS
jgi:hypothetical protein